MAIVEEYEFGRIVINGREYREDVIVHRNGVEEGWWRKEGHRVCLDDIKRIMQLNPEVVVFGTGAYGRMRVDEEVRRFLKERGVEVIEDESFSAVRIFESLLRSGRNAVLAIHLTC
ncbi:Mth938-like domain-containing protein [Geoglobus ahangari]